MGEVLEWCVHFRLLDGRVSSREVGNRCRKYLERVDFPLVKLFEKVVDALLYWGESIVANCRLYWWIKDAYDVADDNCPGKM